MKYTPKYDELIEHRLTHSAHYLGRINQQEWNLLFSDTTQSVAIYLIGDSKKPYRYFGFW